MPRGRAPAPKLKTLSPRRQPRLSVLHRSRAKPALYRAVQRTVTLTSSSPVASPAPRTLIEPRLSDSLPPAPRLVVRRLEERGSPNRATPARRTASTTTPPRSPSTPCFCPRPNRPTPTSGPPSAPTRPPGLPPRSSPKTHQSRDRTRARATRRGIQGLMFSSSGAGGTGPAVAASPVGGSLSGGRIPDHPHRAAYPQQPPPQHYQYPQGASQGYPAQQGHPQHQRAVSAQQHPGGPPGSSAHGPDGPRPSYGGEQYPQGYRTEAAQGPAGIYAAPSPHMGVRQPSLSGQQQQQQQHGVHQAHHAQQHLLVPGQASYGAHARRKSAPPRPRRMPSRTTRRARPPMRRRNRSLLLIPTLSLLLAHTCWRNASPRRATPTRLSRLRPTRRPIPPPSPARASLARTRPPPLTLHPSRRPLCPPTPSRPGAPRTCRTARPLRPVLPQVLSAPTRRTRPAVPKRRTRAPPCTMRRRRRRRRPKRRRTRTRRHRHRHRRTLMRTLRRSEGGMRVHRCRCRCRCRPRRAARAKRRSRMSRTWADLRRGRCA